MKDNFDLESRVPMCPPPSLRAVWYHPARSHKSDGYPDNKEKTLNIMLVETTVGSVERVFLPIIQAPQVLTPLNKCLIELDHFP